MLKISEPDTQARTSFALWQLGFRPFFLGAGSFAVIAMVIWIGLYQYDWPMPLLNIEAITWHAHEMLFGYAIAVIAGFLLTAVKNWTGQQTAQGYQLAVLFLIWASARLLPLFNLGTIEIVALLDCSFLLLTIIAISLPIIKTRQWSQAGIVSKLIIMLVANIIYYAGLLGFIEYGERIGLYSCLYLILALIFVMGRRVIPFFIEKGVSENISLTNRKWLDISSLVLFTALWFFDVIYVQTETAGALAGILFLLHALRLFDWHAKGLWRSPMLWILYAAYSFLTLGFALKAASVWLGVSTFLSIHAFAVGGIGTITLGMMSRVALGHTGRNVNEPPHGLPLTFLLLLLGGLFRVIMPLLLPSQYTVWIGVSQALWIGAFALFVIQFTPILVRPRIDGQPG